MTSAQRRPFNKKIFPIIHPLAWILLPSRSKMVFRAIEPAHINGSLDSIPIDPANCLACHMMSHRHLELQRLRLYLIVSPSTLAPSPTGLLSVKAPSLYLPASPMPADDRVTPHYSLPSLSLSFTTQPFRFDLRDLILCSPFPVFHLSSREERLVPEQSVNSDTAPLRSLFRARPTLQHTSLIEPLLVKHLQSLHLIRRTPWKPLAINRQLPMVGPSVKLSWFVWVSFPKPSFQNV